MAAPKVTLTHLAHVPAFVPPKARRPNSTRPADCEGLPELDGAVAAANELPRRNPVAVLDAAHVKSECIKAAEATLPPTELDEVRRTWRSNGRLLSWAHMAVAKGTNIELHCHPNVEVVYVISWAVAPANLLLALTVATWRCQGTPDALRRPSRLRKCLFALCAYQIRGFRLPQFLGLGGSLVLPTADAWLDWGVIIKWYLQGDVHWAGIGLIILLVSGALSGLLLGKMLWRVKPLPRLQTRGRFSLSSRCSSLRGASTVVSGCQVRGLGRDYSRGRVTAGVPQIPPAAGSSSRRRRACRC